ncbi:MAG: 3-isopropylmalate dehydrogenase [Bacteroidia bacterium]|nr:3-isopropylmalate dehydrogenase [Bacteroidia bacterium]
MNKRIAILAGDGIGPEVITQAQLVLDAICAKFGHTFSYTEALVGAAAIDATGDPYPADTHEVCMQSDAVLFGAIGHPKYDNDPHAKVRPEQGLLRMRKALGLYANLRPVVSYPSLFDKSPLKNDRLVGVDFLVLRELISGIYFGEPRGRSENGEMAFDTCVYRKDEIDPMLHLAFESARKRKNKVTLVDKANVLATSRLWRERFQEIAPQYPDVTADTIFVDNAAMQLILNPAQFDVMVTGNLFGDILSDEGSVLAGSLGILPSASIGEHTSVFEPVHGSYPQATGQNRANPLAAILSAAMLLETAFGLTEEAALVRSAVEVAMSTNQVTEDLGGTLGTKEVGAFIVSQIS